MIDIGDMVKHRDWRDSPVPHYGNEVGLVVANDPRAHSFVQVMWFPLDIHRCKTFHSKDALEKFDGTEKKDGSV